jgi:hypothetical protein
MSSLPKRVASEAELRERRAETTMLSSLERLVSPLEAMLRSMKKIGNKTSSAFGFEEEDEPA